MPSNIDGTFDSSRLLAYKLFLLKYMRLLDEMGGVPSLQALEKFMREIERDFPNEKVHMGDVIIGACALAWNMARTSNRSATEEVQKIVTNWRGTGSKVPHRSTTAAESLRDRGLILPRRIH